MNWAFALVLSLSHAPAGIDEAYSAKIKEYTTEPFFLTNWVDTLPAGKGVPTPMDYLGHVVGAPDVLDYTKDIYGYMRALAGKAPKRVRYEKIGTSEEGRDIVLITISSEANMRNLDRLKAINAKLADPRKTTDAEAEKLFKDSRPFYWFTGGMHAPESGPPEMLMELAYRLAVSDDPRVEAIRNGAVVMITPVLDADGRDRVVDLYRYRKANPTKPETPLVYWGKYVAHDDNRDGMMLSLELSKAMTKEWLAVKPLVLHDLHESVPYLYISTGTGPYNPWLDPIVIDEWHELAYNEIGQMTAMGVPGVWTHGYYDGWAANYGFTVAHGHNGIGRFYETFGGRGADTGILSAGASAARDWFRPNPPFSRVRWSIRNNTNLMETGALIGLSKIAAERETFMRNFWLKSKRSVAKATTEGPAAYVIPSVGPNDGNARALVNALIRQGIELTPLLEDVELEGRTIRSSHGLWPTYVVRMDQPYSRMADMMLDKQYYNPDDPRSYDDTGWQLGPLFNVEVIRIKDPEFLKKKMGHYVQAGSDPTEYTGGVVDGQNIIVAAQPSANAATAAGHLLLSKARMALVHTWTSTQDEGWARIALDQLGVKYSYVSVHELRDIADLKAKYDVILMPDTGGTAQSIVAGRPMVGEPIPWKKTAETPNIGVPDESDDIRGGIELEGVLHLRDFVRNGGLLACVGDMCRVPIDYGIVSGVSVRAPQAINAPGGVFLTENAAKDSLVLAGYDDTLAVYFNSNSLPILSLGSGGGGGRGGAATATRASGRGDLNDADVIQGRAAYDPGRDAQAGQNQVPRLPQPRVLLRYAAEDKLLIAGMLVGGNELAGQAALVDCPVGQGHVLLFSFNPFWRCETVGSYALFFNAAANWNKLAPAKSGD